MSYGEAQAPKFENGVVRWIDSRLPHFFTNGCITST